MLREPQPYLLSPKGISLLPQPALAWIAILGFALFSLASILAGAGNLLNLAFPVGAFIVGFFLYVRYPILYFGFTWWMFFLTPLVRRLADYHSGFTDPSPILLSPFLVVLASFSTLYRHFPKTNRQRGLPFTFTFIGLLYGLFIGLTRGSASHVLVDALQWLSPVLFAFHIFSNWRQYPSYRENFLKNYIWAVLVSGIYGVFQYITAPEWDTYWQIKAEFTTAGIPEPLGIRVWSTMNAPLPFGMMMMAGLLLLFSYRGFLRLPASIFGYLSFMLSLVRTAWSGWFIGIFTLISTLKPNHRVRLIISIAVMALLIIPLTTIDPFAEVINSRFESFSSLEDDGSGLARQETYRLLLMPALTTVVGYGFGHLPDFGGIPLDSAILTMLFRLGWLGTIFYFGGWLLLALDLFRGSISHIDPVVSTARAIVISTLITMPLGPVMIGLPGAVLWGFLGIGLAGQKYHKYQHLTHRRKYR